MASKVDEALVALYRAPFDRFMAERKRLSAELAAEGDKAGASRLSKVTRPPVTAWAVNQLYWQDKKGFAALFKTAERLRDPEPSAAETAAHRDVIASLRTHAATLLSDAGKSTTEGTLRRITTTLSALAATGGFDPDPPGELKGDRDPPGFDIAMAPGPHRPRTTAPGPHPKHAMGPGPHRPHTKKAAAEERRIEREEQRAEKQRAAERERLERKLRIAQGVLEARKEEISRLKESLAEAEEALEGARGVVRELEKELRKR